MTRLSGILLAVAALIYRRLRSAVSLSAAGMPGRLEQELEKGSEELESYQGRSPPTSPTAPP